MPILSHADKQAIMSIQERDRRWKAARYEMDKRKLDALILWGSSGRFRHLNASLRYLCNVFTEGCFILPLKGDPTLFSFIGGYPTPWVADNRTGHPAYSQVMIERIRELSLERGAFGIVELSDYNGEAGFPHTTYVNLATKLPGATFVDATDIITEARIIKSPAEIQCLELGCEAGVKAIDAVVEVARPGVLDFEVRSRFIDTLFREGCEISSMILFHIGKEMIHGAASGMIWGPSRRPVEPGDQIHTEFDASIMGYIAQFNQPFSIGEPPREWADIYKVAVESCHDALKILKPGITVGELNAAFLPAVQKAGYKQRTPNFHGLGLAIEEPFSQFPVQPTFKPNFDRVIQPNMVIGFEPPVIAPDYKRGTTIGAPILVTESGYRILARNWKPELRIAGV